MHIILANLLWKVFKKFNLEVNYLNDKEHRVLAKDMILNISNIDKKYIFETLMVTGLTWYM